MKVKCSFGDFNSASSRGNEAGGKVYNNPLGFSTHAVIHAIPNRCYVLGVNIFNTDDDEKDIRFYDTNYALTTAKSVSTGVSHYSTVQTYPKIYRI